MIPDSELLSDTERAEVVAAIRRCYQHAGLPWPGRVVWAPSPLAGQVLAADLSRQHTTSGERKQAAKALLRQSIRPALAGLAEYGIAATLYCAVLALLPLWGLLTAPLQGSAVERMDRGAYVGAAVVGLLTMVVLAFMKMFGPSGEAGDLTVEQGPTAVEASGEGPEAASPTLRAVLDEIHETSRNAMVGAVVLGGVGMLVGATAGWALGKAAGWNAELTVPGLAMMLLAMLVPAVAVVAVAGGVFRWRLARLRMQCADPAHDLIGRRLDDALQAVHAAIPARRGLSSPYSDVDNRARPVHQAIEKAIHQRLGEDRQVLRYPVGHFDNQYSDQLDQAVSQATYDHPEQDTAVTVIRDFITASRSGWWWPHTRFLVIGERPTIMSTATGPPHIRPDNSVDDWLLPWRRSKRNRRPLNEWNVRLHSTGGPAAAWPDGFRIYAVDGIMVPAELVEDGWTVDTIDGHPDNDVRRAATELVGWMNYIQRAGWRAIATAPDPADPSCELVLYEDRRPRLSPLRVLVTTRGTTDSAEPVPAGINDPVAAAAWRHGCPVSEYRQQQRNT